MALASRYALEGVDGLLRDKTRPPGKAPMTTAKVAKVLALTCSEPPGEVTHWTGRAMAKAMGVSLSAIQRIWAAHHRPQGYLTGIGALGWSDKTKIIGSSPECCPSASARQGPGLPSLVTDSASLLRGLRAYRIGSFKQKAFA